MRDSIVTERDIDRKIVGNPAEGETDPQVLQQLFTLYTESTDKLRLAYERLEKRFREIDPYNIYNSINEALITLDGDEKILNVQSRRRAHFRN